MAKQMPNTRLLTVMDREGDMFELFEDADATRQRVGVLVRARHNRRLEGRDRKLFETLKASQEQDAYRGGDSATTLEEGERGRTGTKRPAGSSGGFNRAAVRKLPWRRRGAICGRSRRSLSGASMRGKRILQPHAKAIEWFY